MNSNIREKISSSLKNKDCKTIEAIKKCINCDSLYLEGYVGLLDETILGLILTSIKNAETSILNRNLISTRNLELPPKES